MSAFQRLLVLGLLLALPFGTASAQGPALSPIVDVTLNAGTTATVNIVAVDTADRQITLSGALPSFGTLNSPTIGTGVVVTTLTLAPTDIHVGTYMTAVMATAGGVSDTKLFRITVNAAGSANAPLVTAPALQEVTVGSTLSFAVGVADPDGMGIASLEASMLPSGATFDPDGTLTSGAFSWTPTASDAGDYDVVFTATGTNELAGGAVTHIRVIGPPMLAIDPIDDVTVEGGSSISVPVSASGLPGATITVTASLPSFATLNPPGSGTGAVNTTITVSPPTGSAGTYHASVTALSEGEFLTELFDIIVTGDGGPDNHPPVLSAPAAATVEIGSMLSFDVTASDLDGDHVDLIGSALPSGSAFVDHGDNTGTFSWIPVAGQGGTHFASFSGLDNRGGSGAASTQILVTGEPVENLPPSLSAPATQQVEEGVFLSFEVTATDPDGDAVMLFADGLPNGATFTDRGDNTGLFIWTPDLTQSGVYAVAFSGSDGQGGSGTASTSITVLDVVVVGECEISGDLEICEGQATELCGPREAISYSWVGPDGFAAETQCVSVDVAGAYELTVVDSEGLSSSCSATVTTTVCDVDNCPRGPGFWKQQCAQRGNGSTKFDREQMDEITSCIDARSEFFDWDSDFDGFCSVVDPSHSMNIRKQTLRMYAVMLANVCTGELGLVTNNGETVSLDPATEIDCYDRNGVNTIAELIAEAELKLAALAGQPLNSEVKAAYERLKDCMDAINNGIGIGPTCTEDEDAAAAACLIGPFKPWRDKTCIRVKPVQGAFEPGDVVLSSVMLKFRDASIAPLSDGVQLDVFCSCEHRHDDDCGDDDHRGGSDSRDKTGGHGHDRDRDRDRHRDRDRDRDRDDDDDHDDDGDHGERCGVSCEERDECDDHHDRHDRDDDDGAHRDDDDDEDDDDRDHAECDTVGIRACFSTEALLALFADAELPCDLLEAEVHFSLTSGATIVATFGGSGHGRDDDDDHDGDRDSGDDDDDDVAGGSQSDGARSLQGNGLIAQVNPNPFNPRTELSFTMTRAGRVRVSIYDVQGRLVRTLLDEVRNPGEQRLVWDGLNARNETVSSGVYFLRIQAPEGAATEKLTVMK